MNILHYTLGLPPHRSGGLTKYATDLFLGQQTPGNVVSLLYAGGVNVICSQKTISKEIKWNTLSTYKINNPVVTPLLHGVKNPISLLGQTKPLSNKEMLAFYEKVIPDIFHIHTLMGLPYELVKFLKNKGTKIIFSSHDYYGLCFKVNFINEKGLLCDKPSGSACARCNYTAPSNLFLRLRNSKFLLGLKNRIPRTNQGQIQKTDIDLPIATEISPKITSVKEQEYTNLIDYYRNIFSLFDYIHFNSEVTKEVYSKYIDVKNSEVISISHSGIKDNRETKKFRVENISISFIGSIDTYKGFTLLKEVLLTLRKQGIPNWTLNIWGGGVGEDKDCSNIKYRGKYSSNELKDIFAETDLLIVPSLCKETFSLITLEALSFGVPVLVSSNVGAKDIVWRYDPNFVYNTKDNLQNILCLILRDTTLLEEYNNKVVTLPWHYSFDQHTKEINNLYNKIINENSIH